MNYKHVILFGTFCSLNWYQKTLPGGFLRLEKESSFVNFIITFQKPFNLKNLAAIAVKNKKKFYVWFRVFLIFFLFFLGKIKKTSIPPLLIKKLQITRKNFFLFLSEKFLFIFLYGWFCYVIFGIDNRYKFFYWKSIDFYQHHFSIENQHEFFYWKSIDFNCDFVLKINEKCSIEKKQLICQLQKL